MRGGASFNDKAMARTTHRYYLPPNTTGGYYTGFRCVKDAPQQGDAPAKKLILPHAS